MKSKSFSPLGLSASLVRVLAGLGVTEPPDIQSQSIPPALAGRDVLASAETGSGKTAAFVLPLLERLQQPAQGPARALVLAPTRELALQIEVYARVFRRASRLSTVALVGGANVATQRRQLAAGAEWRMLSTMLCLRRLKPTSIAWAAQRERAGKAPP